MSVEVEKRKPNPNIKYYIHSIVGIVIMIGFGYLPPIEPITAIGMKYLGIFVGLIYLWSFVEMLWSSMIALVVLIFTGQTGEAITKSAFGNSIIIMCIFAMLIIFALAQTGVFDYLVNWILKLKILQGRPWLLSYALIIGAFVIFALGGELPLLFVFWEMIYKIADSVGIKRKSMYCGAMVVGLMYANVCGLASMPYKPGFAFVMGTFSSITGMPPIEVLPAMVVCLAGSVTTLSLYVLMMRFLLRVDLSALKNANPTTLVKELPPMDKRQKFAAFYLIFFLVALMSTGLVKYISDGGVSAAIQRMGTVGMCWLLAALLLLIKIDGKPMMEVRKIAGMVTWDAVLLMAIAFTLSPMMTAEETGVSAWVMGLINPILGGHSPYVFMVILCVITIVLTNLANNTVVMILMMTVISVYANTMDLNLPIIAVLICIMANTAFMLPASSFYGALIYSQVSEGVSKKSIMLSAVLTMMAVLIAMVLVIIPLGSMIL